MQLIHLTLVNFLFLLCCSAGPIAHFVPKIRDLGPGDESAHISQPSSLVLHNLQGFVSSEKNDFLTVIPVTPSLTQSPLVPDTSSADHTHPTTQSVEQSSASAPVLSHTIATTTQSTVSVSTTSDDNLTAHPSQEATSTSTSVPTPENSNATPSQSSPTVHGHTDITLSSQNPTESPSLTSHNVPSGPSLTAHSPPSVHSAGLHSTISPPVPSPPQIPGQTPSGASATVSNPAIKSSEQHSTGSSSIPPLSLNSAQRPSVSGPSGTPHGTTHRTEPTGHGTHLSPSLSSPLTPTTPPTTPSSPAGSVAASTTGHSHKSSAPPATSTNLAVGVVGLLPGEVSGGSSLSVPPNPLETTNGAHSNSVATGSNLDTGKPSGSLPTGLSTTTPFPGEFTIHSSSSAQTHKTPPPTNADESATETATITSNSAQKEPSSVISSGLPTSNQHTAPSVSDPVIVIVTPGQSTSWTNTWLRVSDSTSMSSTSSSTTTTTTHTTIRPSGTIAIPEIPTGPSRDPETSIPEPTAPHQHSSLPKGTDTVTTIHAFSTVTKVVTVPASDEPEAPASAETKDPQTTTQEPEATATPNQTEKASDIPNPPSPSRKIKPTAEGGVPATEYSTTSAAQPTGAIEYLQGLQVVPVTPQGFVTVTETKTETTTKTKTKTETETETEIKTVYIHPTLTVTAGS
ncbi:uncharacterized protein KD926_007096 [Aspergillus affinis]|uniref:uncharacterized protein n=1 Tax=Aspergillus affinis TaxID=1070780 RepID=UPI0022FDC516|nr:uncharacterized protein KD926_007096 [Aspergillus affinis]KAI9045793.1 hypothetical protein KD926_007096 [Aspergillus affinis]